MLDRLLGEEFLDLGFVGAEEGEGGADDAVEEEGEVDEEGEAGDLEPLEGLPAEPERHHPDEQGPARVDGRPRRRAHVTRHREPEEVEASARRVFG